MEKKGHRVEGKHGKKNCVDYHKKFSFFKKLTKNYFLKMRVKQDFD